MNFQICPVFWIMMFIFCISPAHGDIYLEGRSLQPAHIGHCTVLCMGYCDTVYLFARLLFNPKSAKKNSRAENNLFLFLIFQRNNAWHYMWIVCQADDSHVMSIIISSEKYEKNMVSECRLPFVIGAWRVKYCYLWYILGHFNFFYYIQINEI